MNSDNLRWYNEAPCILLEIRKLHSTKYFKFLECVVNHKSETLLHYFMSHVQSDEGKEIPSFEDVNQGQEHDLWKMYSR